MARQINMPEPDKELSDADIEVLSPADCALEITKQLSAYMRQHGLTGPKGPGMKLLARARTLLSIEPTEVTSGIEGEQYVRLMNAITAVYYAAFWHADRPLNTADALWAELRDAAGFENDRTSSAILPSDYNVFLVHAKHSAMIKSTLEYLQQTDPVA